ncbi:hypothetical protein AYI69_g7233 [Smittium culicis]|uniref:Uncharacterized protein n=1 Tax=Smittium culicis TaxID=133412 RepID=A0A1R1XTI9_9FUNG|nr:hypothetical protein AYI69_g7233 [Smittium culicis]
MYFTSINIFNFIIFITRNLEQEDPYITTRGSLHYNKRIPTLQQEDPYITTRILGTDFTVYPELTEALPSIEHYFFRSPLTEEERKN